MADQEVKVRITTDASQGVAGVDKMKSSLKKMEGESQSLTSKIKQHWLGISAAIAGAALAVNKAWDLAEKAAQFEQSKVAFKSMTESMGADASRLYAQLKQKSAGLIDEKSLIESANRAMSLGIPVEKLGELMEISRAKARDMGITTTQAFNDIATGIGRASPKILDNLGLILKIGTANEKMAQTLGKTVEELTDKEKQMAILNATLEAGKEALGRYDLATLTTSEKMQKLAATAQNLQLLLGQGLIRAAAGGMGALQSIAAAALMASSGLFKLLSLIPGRTGESFRADATAAFEAGKDLWRQAKDNFSAMISTQEELAAAMRPRGGPEEEPDKTEIDDKLIRQRLNLQKKLTDEIKRITLSETEYKIWALNQEVAEMRNVAGESKLLQDLISEYRRASLADMVKEFEKAYAQIGQTEFDLARAEVEEQAQAFREAGADAIRVAEWVEAQLKSIHERENADKIKIQEDFVKQYSELGLTPFDLERKALAEQVEAWRQAEVDKTQLMEYESRRRAQISREEFHDRLETVQGLVGGVASLFEDLANADARYSREAFYVYKAFKMAEVQISTASAVMKAFEGAADKSGIGLALAYMQAAMAAAFGITQTALIANAQPPSYDEGGVSTRPGIYYSGVPEAHIPLKSGSVPVEFKGREEKEIRLEIANIVSPELLDAYIASPRGRRAMLNFIGQNAGTVRRVIRS